ncbi:MAG: hypothetical protein WDZ26_00995 [Nitriliruptoraceae bacterium]
MSTAYERVKGRVDELEARFYALLDAVDDYADLLDELTVEQESSETPDPELIRRFAHQRSHTDDLREQIEGPPMDTLLRVVDRILMIRETEEGRFL